MIKLFVKEETKKENVILFIHGFLGGYETWMDNRTPKSFISYLFKDEVIQNNFDYGIFDYYTSISDVFQKVNRVINFFTFNKKPKKNLNINEIAELLESEISVKLSMYKRIVIISHSMGGIIAKAYLTKKLNPQISLFISLAVPHNGTNIANISKLILNNPQIKDLSTLSESIALINSKWVKNDISTKLPITVYHQAKYDSVVVKEAAEGFDSRDVEVIYSEHDHFSITKPDSKNDIVVVSSINQIKDILHNTPLKEKKETTDKSSIIIKNSTITDSFNKH